MVVRGEEDGREVVIHCSSSGSGDSRSSTCSACSSHDI